MPFLILADDLSGAAELAGLAHNLGHNSEIRRVGCAHQQISKAGYAHEETSILGATHQAGTNHATPASAAAASVIALDTDTRHLHPTNANTLLRQITQEAQNQHLARLYKKTDSLLRGNVRTEIEAFLQATNLPRAVLIPANPSRGRTIVAGQYLINGQPLHQTPLAADPHHPRLTSDVRTLLGDGLLKIHCPKPTEPLPPTGIIVPDVTSTADLTHLASQIDQDTLPAGAADFFAALLEAHPSPSPPPPAPNWESLLAPPALLVCGSRIAWPARQKAATTAQIAILAAQETATLPAESPAYALGIASQEVTPSTALAQLSRLAAQLIRERQIQTILVEGGETAAALAAQLGWTRLALVAPAPAGVGVLRPLTAEPAPLVLTKPGSYPWPADIWTAFANLART